MSYDVREIGDAPSIDRTPPQDLQAEQSVLGAMLTSKDAVANVLEIVKGRDFYRPAHELIFDAILDLYGKGEPADAITVAAELTRRGDIARCGGHVYIHDLLASVAIAANASYYADIVREKAILRRLVEASIKIAQMGYQATGEVSDIVDHAQQIVYEVADGKTSEDYKPLTELIEPTWNELEAIASRGGRLAGVPTGFADLDELTNGLHPGQMIILAARPAIGKALALGTPLVTPTGWTTMGEVRVGDRLMGADGRPTTVVAATEVMTGRPCYRVEFDDGTGIVADADHQWAVDPIGASLGWGGESAAPAGDGPARRAPRAVAVLQRFAAEVLTTRQLAGQPGRYEVPPAGPLQVVPGGARVPTHGASRRIVAVEPVPSVPVRCVQVDNDDHLYLAGDSMVPTHNSTLALDFARSAAIKHKLTTAIFSLEMSSNEIMMRLLSAEAGLALHKMRNGKINEDDWERLAKTTGKVQAAPLFIDDSPNLTMMEIRAKARRLKQRHDLKMVIIDYLQLMTSGKKVESRQVEVSEFSRSIKLLAKELEIPVIAISQLNRGSEQRGDKKPMLSDLRESGSLEQDADMVILLHREEAYNKDERPGEADFIVAKHRNGETRTIVAAFQGHYSRFVDMQYG